MGIREDLHNTKQIRGGREVPAWYWLTCFFAALIGGSIVAGSVVHSNVFGSIVGVVIFVAAILSLFFLGKFGD